MYKTGVLNWNNEKYGYYEYNDIKYFYLLGNDKEKKKAREDMYKELKKKLKESGLVCFD